MEREGEWGSVDGRGILKLDCCDKHDLRYVVVNGICTVSDRVSGRRKPHILRNAPYSENRYVKTKCAGIILGYEAISRLNETFYTHSGLSPSTH